MEVPGFIYGSYENQSVVADVERTVNWYVELPSQGSGGKPVLLPTPGIEVVATTQSRSTVHSPGRAHFFEGDREFAVIGADFFEIDRDGTLTAHADVGVDEFPATISSNGDGGGQLFITSAGNGFVFDLTTNITTQVTALNGLATMGDFLDGYFLVLDTNTSTLYISALFDGLTWTPGTDFAQRSVASDAWVSMKVLGRYVWLFGEHTSEAWYNTGDSFPLALHPSSLIRFGCAAPWSVAIAEDSIMWLHSSTFGEGQVILARGFSPQIISSYAVANDIGNTRSPAGAVGGVYSDSGHTFYCLSIPTASTTWVFDLTTNQWHERATWVESQYQFWRPSFFVRAFGETRCLDWGSGTIYRLSREFGVDTVTGFGPLGAVSGYYPIRRLRRAPAIQKERDRLFYNCFELDMEAGQGTFYHDVGTISIGITQNTEGGGQTTLVTFAPSATSIAGTYDWDFGDGNTVVGADETEIVGNTFDVSSTHTFFIALTVTTAAGTVYVFTFTKTWVPVLDITTEATTFRSESGGEVMMRFSDDGGKTWSNEQIRDAGKLGEYSKRIRWNRLGQSRRRVFEVAVTDALPWSLTNAYVEVYPEAKSA